LILSSETQNIMLSEPPKLFKLIWQKKKKIFYSVVLFKAALQKIH